MPRAPTVTPLELNFTTFGDCLKYLRRRALLTQAELASACGYSPPHISHLENNQRLPDQTTLLALFVPALGLQDEPELVERLLELAAAARREAPSTGGAPQRAPTTRHNLPSPATPFVGRSDELARIANLLDDPACRLLALTGPGGIGKTRLALHAAAQRLGDFSDGAFFVSLVGVRSPDLIISTIADALSFEFQSGSGSGMAGGDRFGGMGTDAVEGTKTQLLNYLRARNLLLVMDNFEHLLDGVGLLPDILGCAPAVKILATSREPLALREEWVFAVSGLDVPDAEPSRPLEAYSAVQLFAQRARHVQVGFSLAESAAAVTRICRQVDGMPLGIELAAGLLRAVPIAEIADQIEGNLDLLETSLRDVPERHRSLRAMFEQSWSLLAEAERAALMKLSVFRGGFRREAAAYVTEAPFRVLLALVNKSLVRLNRAGRYDVHELLRQFAEDKLKAMPGAWETAQDRHCAYYAEFVHARQTLLEIHIDKTATEDMQADIENVQAAWSRAVATMNSTQIGLLLRGFHLFLVQQGWLDEGWETFRNAADTLSHAALDDAGQLALGQVLTRQAACGTILHRSWQDREALLQRSLSIVQPLDAQWDIAYAFKFLGMGEFDQRRLAPARDFFEKSLEIFRAVGATAQMIDCLLRLGMVALEEGRVEEALATYRNALATARQTGSTWMSADALARLGDAWWKMARYPEARDYYEESLALRRSMGSRRFLAETLSGFAWVAWLEGEYSEARQLAQESLQIAREAGSREAIGWSLFQLGLAESGLGDHGAAIHIIHEAISVGRELNAQLFVANGLNGLSCAYWSVGDYAEAKRSAQESLAILRETGSSFDLAAILDTLSHATESLGQRQEAKGYFLEGLKIDLEMKTTGIDNALFSVGGMAKVLAAEGQPDRALMLLGLVLGYTENPRPDLVAFVKPLLTEFEAELPPEVLAAGLERGKSLDLETVIRELLEEST